MQEVAYQAALASTARLVQPSLVGLPEVIDMSTATLTHASRRVEERSPVVEEIPVIEHGGADARLPRPSAASRWSASTRRASSARSGRSTSPTLRFLVVPPHAVLPRLRPGVDDATVAALRDRVAPTTSLVLVVVNAGELAAGRHRQPAGAGAGQHGHPAGRPGRADRRPARSGRPLVA